MKVTRDGQVDAVGRGCLELLVLCAYSASDLLNG
jgi:hypothetical protein